MKTAQIVNTFCFAAQYKSFLCRCRCYSLCCR